MLNWYAIYTKPRYERVVAEKLSNCGFNILNPLMKEKKVYRRKLQEVITPLFPCYIFVNLDIIRYSRLVKYTRGVKSIVGTAYTPAIVPDAIINSMLDRMENGIITTVRIPEYHSGDEVIIRAGAFEGFEALFERELNGTERVSILLKALNARITLDRALLSRP